MNVMIDIEALACPENLPPGHLVEVCQIGAVAFLPNGQSGNIILAELNLFPTAGNGLCDPKTVGWWIDQVMQHGFPVWHQRRRDLRTASMKACLIDLADFIATHKPEKIWAKNPAYDKSILQLHYAALRMPCPLRKVHDVRTIQDWYGIKDDPDGPHDALADCLSQIGILVDAGAERGAA